MPECGGRMCISVSLFSTKFTDLKRTESLLLNPKWIPKGYISQYFLLYVLVTLMIHALNTRVLVLTIFSSFLCSGPTPPP